MKLGWLGTLRKRFIMSLDENYPILLLPLFFKEKLLQLSHKWIFMLGFVRHLYGLEWQSISLFLRTIQEERRE